jgi:hypothetical protein
MIKWGFFGHDFWLLHFVSHGGLPGVEDTHYICSFAVAAWVHAVAFSFQSLAGIAGFAGPFVHGINKLRKS